VIARALPSPKPLTALACLALAALGLAASAGGALDAGAKLRFSSLPKRVVQGQPASVTVAAARGARCSLVVRYGDGMLQPGLSPTRATNGRARWSWHVPETAGTGPAKLVATCGGSRVTAAMPVVAGARQPGVTVTKQGFSQRWRGRLSTASYGVVLTNTSAERDARDVVVLVNFVDAANTVLATDESIVQGIAARTPFYLGGSMSVPTTPIARLEITVRVSSRAPRSIHEPPLADIRILPSRSDPSYVGAVAGQVLNDKAGNVLRNASFYAVVFDAAGSVVGGSSGRLRAPLPHGIREFFDTPAGADSMPMARAVSAQVSVDPQYVVSP
jgi:hypothetical protein